MACQVCDHTMQSITGGIFWCPRCGTLKFEMGVPQWESPRTLKTILLNLHNCDDSIPRDEPGPISGPLWAKVSHLFGLGSTSATKLCQSLNVDPECRRTA